MLVLQKLTCSALHLLTSSIHSLKPWLTPLQWNYYIICKVFFHSGIQLTTLSTNSRLSFPVCWPVKKKLIT